MDVDVAVPRSSDAGEFVAAVQASRSLHQPWLDPPDTLARFAAYLDRAARDDQAAYLIRHRHCGSLVGYVNVNNIVRGGFQSGFLGYGAFASRLTPRAGGSGQQGRAARTRQWSRPPPCSTVTVRNRPSAGATQNVPPNTLTGAAKRRERAGP
jgi:RimJ/RimL family protein N-acetyltransferase